MMKVINERYGYRTHYISNAEDTGTPTKHCNTKTLIIEVLIYNFIKMTGS